MQIFEIILFFKLRTIQQKTVKPTYLLSVRCQEAGGRKRARDCLDEKDQLQFSSDNHSVTSLITVLFLVFVQGFIHIFLTAMRSRSRKTAESHLFMLQLSIACTASLDHDPFKGTSSSIK